MTGRDRETEGERDREGKSERDTEIERRKLETESSVICRALSGPQLCKGQRVPVRIMMANVETEPPKTVQREQSRKPLSRSTGWSVQRILLS